MDRHSRTIAILKVVLPLAALALLSTLFLLSRKVDPDAVLPFAEREIADRLRDQQITAPTFTGTSTHGDDVFLTAAKVSPPIAGRPARAEDLRARIVSPGGSKIVMSATRGSLQDMLGKVSFAGAVHIETSAGYVIDTELLEADLNAVSATSPGPVAAHGPPGRITAGSMRITSDGAGAAKSEGRGLHIVFQNGVRLIYDPQKVER